MRIIIEPSDSAATKMMAEALKANGLAMIVESDQVDDKQVRFRDSLRALMEEPVFKHKYDHAWVMDVVNQYTEEFGIRFVSARDYVFYVCKTLGFGGIVSYDTLRKMASLRSGHFPNWYFRSSSPVENNRRINVARRFLNLYRQGCNG